MAKRRRAGFGVAVLVLVAILAAAGSAWAAPGEPAAADFGSQKVQLNGIDLAVIGLYLAGVVGLGCVAGLWRRNTRGSDYFLASRTLTWPVIGTALFATNISTIHLVSFAQNGYTSGLTYGNYEWMAAFTLVILALFFAPFYLRSGVATLPDFMERRYSRGSRDYLAILSIFSAIVVHIGFSLHTGAIVLEGTVLPNYVADPEQYRLVTVIALCAVTALYTIVGGLLAVVLTESIQTVVMLVGSTAITWIGLQAVGGWGGLVESVHPVNLTVLRDGSDPTGVTWYAVFLGYPVLGIWYWCTDQTIVQRVLGAKDENHARLGPIFAGFIKILPVFIFVLPGIVCLGLIHQGKLAPLPVNAAGQPMTEHVYTHMINQLLFSGMRGLVIAAMLAALMSTVSGALNSIATLFSYDIYRRFQPSSDDRHLVRVGRLATFVAMCVAIAWTMAMQGMDTTIFQAMVDVFPVVAPPTAVVFVWGVFWKRTSARAALWTLIGGSLLGLALYATELARKHGWIDVDPASLFGQLLAVNSLFMSFILFVVESAFIVAVSLVWPHRHTAESAKLVWKSPLEALRTAGAWRGLLDYRVAAVLLVLTMIGLYVGFSLSPAYYPVSGTVTLAGQPVVGADVVLDTEGTQLDARLSSGIDGKYCFATTQQAGGAPAGAKYRVRLEPRWDYLVKLPSAEKGTKESVLAEFPAGTSIGSVESVRKVSGGGKRVYVLNTDPPRKVETEIDARVEIRRATAIPARYCDFATSGLGFSATRGAMERNLDLK